MTWLHAYAIFVTLIALILYYLVWQTKKLLLQLSDVLPSEWDLMRKILRDNLDGRAQRLRRDRGTTTP